MDNGLKIGTVKSELLVMCRSIDDRRGNFLVNHFIGYWTIKI